jgi:CRISPR-associated protein Cas1
MHDGATLGASGELLTVSVKRERKQEIHTTELRQLVLLGNVTLTPGAIDLVVRKGIDAILLGHHGRYRGRVAGSLSGNITLRLAQYRSLTDPARSLGFARALVLGKLANQRAQLKRHLRRHRGPPSLGQAARALGAAALRAEGAASLDELRGCEGAGAAAYFRVFGDLIRVEGFRFDGRNRRPPMDPVNALLSFGYTLLANQVESATELVGLDPHLGALHAPLSGRPSLVCDLMEEHRPRLVDSVVLTGLNKAVFSPEQFDQPEPESPVLMKREAIRALITLFERRLEQRVLYGPRRLSLTWRDVLEQQCRAFARWLLDGSEYTAFTPA